MIFVLRFELCKIQSVFATGITESNQSFQDAYYFDGVTYSAGL